MKCAHVVSALRVQGVKHIVVPLLDESSEDIGTHFATTVAHIQEHMEGDGRVLVHCVQGISRSASIVTAYLMMVQGASLTHALGLMRAARPIAQPNPGFMRQLKALEATLPPRPPRS